MNREINPLLHGYFDESLTAEEHDALGAWIKADSRHASEFAKFALLHDQLRNEFALPEQPVVQPLAASRQSRWAKSLYALATVSAVFVLGLFLWQVVGTKTVSAAGPELNRIISASARVLDRIYVIAVEETVKPEMHEHLAEKDRPPKPSLDGALLHLRGPNEFVLQRKLDNEQQFVTGSDGKVSWAVRPDGPVRVSSELTRFNRDVPGHEHDMPLSNLHDGLEQLQTAYDVQVLPEEPAEGEGSEPSRLLVAVKKRGFRGPRRVEITYAATSGEIRQLRFVDMPYGPDRITIRMTLVGGNHLDAAFFNHEHHHDQARVVEFEE